MRAVLLDRFGEEDVMRIDQTPPPPLVRPRDVRVAVHATAVNRADLLQRQGRYPPPAGASDLLGLECAGVVVESGAEANVPAGSRVMALLAGGGYAEEAVVDAGSLMPIPPAMPFEEAAAIPEAFLTAFLNIFLLARAREGERVLIHGGGSGVGTSATTLCRLAGLRVVVTAGSDDKVRRCLAHGADIGINYTTTDFAEKAGAADVILDHIGARYLERNLRTLATGGRLVLIGGMGGMRMAEVDVDSLIGRRQQVIGSTLRARPLEEKAAIVAAFLDRFGRNLAEGQIRPVIDRILPLHEVAAAHRAMKSSEHFGKIVLRIR